MSDIEGALEQNPDYIQILSELVEYEESNKCPDKSYIADKEYDSCWTYKDVGVQPQTLYQMETDGLIDRVFDTNSTTAYSLKSRQSVKRELDRIERRFDDGVQRKEHEFPSVEELDEMEIFSDVVGYEGAKWLIKKAIASDNRVNIVLFGPPGSGKSVFLRCIEKLEGGRMISGKNTSSAGFVEEMFENKPRFMCIDELDDMSNDDQKVLSDYTEEGRLVETKGNDKRRELEIDTKTFAAANHEDNIIDQINNRFTDLHFERYSLEEFKEVCKNIIPREYGHSKEHASEIAEAIWEMEGFGNVRKAEDVAALSDGDDPEKVVSVLEDYS